MREWLRVARIRAAAQADIRRVTGPGTPLSLAAEAAAAQQLPASAGITVVADMPDLALPGVADEVLAPVLRDGTPGLPQACNVHLCPGGLPISGWCPRH